MKLPVCTQTSHHSSAECVPSSLCAQGEPGYVLGGVEVIPGRNGQPGPPVSIISQVWWTLQLLKGWQRNKGSWERAHIPPSLGFHCCRDTKGSQGFLG